MKITALYAALLGLMLVALGLLVIRERYRAKVALGHGESRALMRRARVHANFAEYVPMAVVLIGLAESLAADPRVLHGLGAVLLGGRLLHAWGMSQDQEPFGFRRAGMISTFLVLISASITCLGAALGRGLW